MKPLLTCIFIFSFLFAKTQTISAEVLEIASQKCATNIFRVLDNNKTDIKIIVLPIYDVNDTKTSESDQIGKAIAHQLNQLSNQNFVVWYYTDFNNKDLTNEINRTSSNNRDSYYYTNLIQKFQPTHLITGNYAIDNNSFHIQNINLYENWIDNDEKIKVLSVANVSENMQLVNKKQYITRSLILPGWGQLQKQEKTKGTTFIISSGILIASTITSQTLYSYNYNNYLNAIKYGKTNDATIYQSNYESWYIIRNVSLISLAGVYIFNIIDAATSTKHETFANNIKIYPNYLPSSYSIHFAINIK